MPMRQTGMATRTITLTHYAEDTRRKTSSLIAVAVPDRGLLSPSPANALKTTPANQQRYDRCHLPISHARPLGSSHCYATGRHRRARAFPVNGIWREAVALQAEHDAASGTITVDYLPVPRVDIELSDPPTQVQLVNAPLQTRKILALVRLHSHPLGTVVLDGTNDLVWRTHGPAVWSAMRSRSMHSPVAVSGFGGAPKGVGHR